MALFGHLFFSPKVTNDDQLGTAIETSVDRLQRLRLQFFNGCVRALSLELMELRSPFVRSDADFALRGFQFRLLTNHVGTNRYVSRELFEKLVDAFPSRMVAGDGAPPEETGEPVEKIWSYASEFMRCSDTDEMLATVASHVALFLARRSTGGADLLLSARISGRICPYGMFLALNIFLIAEDLFGTDKARLKFLRKRNDVFKQLGDFYGLQSFS
jgi:hypothetical protein